MRVLRLRYAFEVVYKSEICRMFQNLAGETGSFQIWLKYEYGLSVNENGGNQPTPTSDIVHRHPLHQTTMLVVIQAEQSEIKEKLNQLKLEVEKKAESLLSSLKEEEDMVIEQASAGRKEMERIEDMV
ncbi:unnamed protein product [Arabis nemorensis]|uniref:Uncharacterized protein n=1 Tax=Arabis nemorensis TaxID=586526 RepID=A0A565C4P0_9BRAS|nr:unnamed protein product [Arabis nemorensis]